MSILVYIILLSSLFFIALTVNLAIKPKYYNKLLRIITVFDIICGLLIYSYCYALSENNILISTIRTIFSTFSMFVGKNEYSLFSSTPLCSNIAARAVFWFSHLSAFYTTANAALTTIGANAVKHFRAMMIRNNDLVIIFGRNIESASFAKEFCQDGNSVIFYSDSLSSDVSSYLDKLNLLVKIDNSLSPSQSFLNSIGANKKNRKIDVFAISEDDSSDLQFALNLVEVFSKAGISPKCTSITIPYNDESIADLLQNSPDKYGYGYVHVFNRHNISSRMMIQKCPPWDKINFDNNCLATEDFDALIIGFDKTGQAVLKQLIMNSQFEGSNFHATIISKNVLSSAGYIRNFCPDLFKSYNIDFIDSDGRSDSVYTFLSRNKNTLKYIAVCTGDIKISSDISSQITNYIYFNNLSIPVIEINSNGIRIWNNDNKKYDQYRVLSKENLSGSKIDYLAMHLNHVYMHDDSVSVWEHWKSCKYLDRMSSRACADFFLAYIKASGMTANQVFSSWNLNSMQLENLGKTEHLRWSAFLYCMGFHTMSEKEWNERAVKYKEELSKNGYCSFKMEKDILGRSHACLIPWDQLPLLDEREKAVTGILKNYQQADIDNVLMVPTLLKLKESTGG